MAVFRYTRVRIHNPAAKRAAKAHAREVKLAEQTEQHAHQVHDLPKAATVTIWTVVAVLTLAMLVVHPLAGLVFGAAVGLGAYKALEQRKARVKFNRARYQAAGVDPDTGRPVPQPRTGFEDMAATYDRHGMPESAKAYRDLADEQPGRHSA